MPAKQTKIADLLSALGMAESLTAFFVNLHALNKTVENYKHWVDINGNFKNYIYIPKKGNILSNSLALQINIKLDYRENLKATNLYSYDLHDEERVIDKFYVSENMCDFSLFSEYTYYDELERNFYYVSYSQTMLIKMESIKSTFKTYGEEEILELLFVKVSAIKNSGRVWNC